MKNAIIFFLITIIFGLFYLILTGSLFSCSPVKCPNYCEDQFRSFFS